MYLRLEDSTSAVGLIFVTCSVASAAVDFVVNYADYSVVLTTNSMIAVMTEANCYDWFVLLLPFWQLAPAVLVQQCFAAIAFYCFC